MEKRRRGGLGALCLLCAGVLACLQPQPAGAADAKWHANPGRHDGTGAVPPAAHHTGLPPLSAPPPTAGADLPPSLPPTQPAPHFGFPLQPTLGSAPPPSRRRGVVGLAATARVHVSMIGLGVIFAIVFLITSC
ncbi:bile salt-activated lipase-like [Panicum miliaceum]|uniref:Bile salt-activated lipase-like n=1 Tax=Panicum miliaceum TaxID=4540 RepID=A0A3L6PSV5_PANMI|nr:bile salt-activated lipase-like [Panicum miliaceum]